MVLNVLFARKLRNYNCVSPTYMARHEIPFGQESILSSCVFNDCYSSFNCVCCSFRALNMLFLKSSIILLRSARVWFSNTWFRRVPCLRMSDNFNEFNEY